MLGSRKSSDRLPPLHDIHDGRSRAQLSQRGDERMSEVGERGRARECPGMVRARPATYYATTRHGKRIGRESSIVVVARLRKPARFGRRPRGAFTFS